MRKWTVCLLVTLCAVIICLAPASAESQLPGVLADFTEQASVITNEACRSYEHFFFDYDGDGVDEMFFLVGYDPKDGTWPLAATIYEGAEYASDCWSPPKKIPDTAEIRTVCFIDVNPEDGRKDLVISVVGPDGSEYTTILQGSDEHSDDPFGKQWKDGSDKPILSGLFRGITEDGILLIGDTKYAWDEKYWLKTVGTLEPGEILFPGMETPEETPEPAPTEEPAVPEPAAETEPPAEVSPAPAAEKQAPASSGEGGPIRTEVQYTATGFVSRGIELDPAVLPEYSLLFHEDGTAVFVLAGTTLPTLEWTRDGQDFILRYAGQDLRCVPDGDGFTVDIFGTITARMEP